ncbi:MULTISPECIES: type III secretion system inner membrane ring lipoprotein SctJ [Rubrivivax]|uniref:Lipoprotein n=2 Tax=Rubrivivax benzoatilyticus TaxID=316997 RepID=A0ABX0HTY5_9BURK|nr:MULTISPECIES: type III secretion inner membrane ring lipoprotein SctJ [Rubrivivax]NHK96810.1 type III secretion inner membrane ring lipoprotein SctJ [Rubrivivax benzoatilyticus]NHL24525.1 type III secretion inner membrane ring lipoprotein SctJ [Rubrivivax benzoatilyticus]
MPHPPFPARTRARLRRLALLLAATAALAGCGREELYAQLDEREANEMVALLTHAGIDAAKQRVDGGQFALRVGGGEFARAVQVLHAAGYPREGHESLGTMFKKEGFVTTQLEERARFMHALSQELAGTLQNIDGVVLARVHLAVPEKRRFAEKPEPSAAAVFLKVRPGVDLAPQIGSIKALVVNAIEGLPYEQVTVVTFPAEPWPGPAAPAAATALDGLGRPLLWAAALGGSALAIGGGLWFWQRRRGGARHEIAPLQAVAGSPHD